MLFGGNHLSGAGLESFAGEDGPAKAADGVAQIDGVSAADVFEAQDALFGVGVSREDVAAVDAGEQAAVNWRGNQASARFDKHVVDCALCNFPAPIEEENVIITGRDCRLEGFCVERAVGGFVEVHRISGIGALSGDADVEGLG